MESVNLFVLSACLVVPSLTQQSVYSSEALKTKSLIPEDCLSLPVEKRSWEKSERASFHHSLSNISNCVSHHFGFRGQINSGCPHAKQCNI